MLSQSALDWPVPGATRVSSVEVVGGWSTVYSSEYNSTFYLHSHQSATYDYILSHRYYGKIVLYLFSWVYM